MIDPNQFTKDAYRYWFEFLKRSDKGKWCKETSNYFNWVGKRSFDAWWGKYADVVSIPQRHSCESIRTLRDFKDYYDDGIGEIIWVNLSTPKPQLMRALSKLIVKLEAEHPDKCEEYVSQPIDLPLAMEMNDQRMKALAITLQVFDACLLADQQKAKKLEYLRRHEICDDLNLPISKNLSTQSHIDETTKRLRKAITVCRYNRWAKEVIKNAERKCIFPHRSGKW